MKCYLKLPKTCLGLKTPGCALPASHPMLMPSGSHPRAELLTTSNSGNVGKLHVCLGDGVGGLSIYVEQLRYKDARVAPGFSENLEHQTMKPA